MASLFDATDAFYPPAGPVVDGRRVLKSVPNLSSIGASLTDYRLLYGVREVPLSRFSPSTSYSATEYDRAVKLAADIAASRSIAPLIVVVDHEGPARPYVLEGGHRLDALFMLGARALPAVVVVDEEHEAGLSSGSRGKREWPWLTLKQIAKYEPLAKQLHVSEVARSPRGFLPAFKRAGGDPRRLSPYWWGRRQDFVARHMAQAKARGEAFLRTGEMSPRHLALVMWAYSPRL
jgi:hypothetical protein